MTAQQTELPPPAAATPSPDNQAVIDEINAIRQQLGGGIGAQLKGLITDDSLESELKKDFERELNRRLNQESPTRKQLNNQHARPSSAEPNSVWPVNPIDRLTELVPFENSLLRLPLHVDWPLRRDGIHRLSPARSAIQGPVIADHASASAAYSSESHASKVLRNAARQLEIIAADLEDAGLYGQSDLIREQAGKFWLQSR